VTIRRHLKHSKMQLLNTAKPGIRLTPGMLKLQFGHCGSTVGRRWAGSLSSIGMALSDIGSEKKTALARGCTLRPVWGLNLCRIDVPAELRRLADIGSKKRWPQCGLTH
jgi:hypothetical protein